MYFLFKYFQCLKFILFQYSAIIKNRVELSLNSGTDCDTPQKFGKAMTEQGGIANVIILIGSINGSTPEPQKKISNISSLHSFEFLEEGLRIRKVCGIGNGKLIQDLQKLPCQTKFDYTILNAHQLENGKPIKRTSQPFKKHGEIEKVSENKDIQDEEEADFEGYGSKGVFLCPKTPCKCEYINYKNLEKHLVHGICKIDLRDKSQGDEITEMYISAFGMSAIEECGMKNEVIDAVNHMENLKEPNIDLSLPRVTVDMFTVGVPIQSQFKVGFALPFPRTSTKFTANQEDYLYDLFEAGIESKKKANPAEVEVDMRKIMVSGKPRFKDEEWLSESQIRSYFSKLAANSRRGVYKKKHPKLDTLEVIMNPHVQDPLEEDQECLEDAANHLQAVEDEVFHDEIFTSIVNGERLEGEVHPIMVRVLKE